MQYTCHDINRILSSSQDDAIDQAAFLAHIESCSSCGQLDLLSPDLEKALGSLLPSSAPGSISLNIMKTIRIETKDSYASTIANRIRYALLGAFYLIIAAIALSNYRFITNGITSSWHSLDQTWELFRTWGAIKEPLLSYSNKLILSPLVLTALIGATVIIWIFSILRFREITK